MHFVKMPDISDAIAGIIILMFLCLVFVWPTLFAVHNSKQRTKSGVVALYSDKCIHSANARNKLGHLPWITWINIQFVPTISVPSCDGKFASELFSTRKRITAGTQSAALQAEYISFLKKEFQFNGYTPHFCVIIDGKVDATCTGFPCDWYK